MWATRSARTWCWIAALLISAAVPAAQANEAGRTKSAACSACHGRLGLATLPDAPNLAGQPAIYVEAQLKAYRSGARQHPVMNVVAQYLSDADIAALAAWYASLKVEVKEP
ncbi:cytochrome c [uncultured Methylibium sp.]|uniref:c-type cytochrome n=1 Tax=uncultured Methylibium sp. TaxID=381093 RepID=UPI0025FDA53E|nr:cytochrome c [uncultured Methylibium sp.]